MAYGAVETREYSPLSSVTDAGSNPRQPSWAEGLSPVSTDNNHSSWFEEDEEDALVTVGSKSVPAKLFTRDREHLLQIQVCWACRLALSQTSDKKLIKLSDENPPQLTLPHFAVSSWSDIADVIHSDNGIDASEMVFWLRQHSFEKGSHTESLDSAASTCASSFDALCSSSAEDYAKATDLQCSMIFPVEEACLRCRRSSLLPVILNESAETRHAVQSAILFKESALRARAIGAQSKKYTAAGSLPQNTPAPAVPSLSAPSTPFTAATAIKRHVTESPPDGRRQVVNLFAAIGLNEQNWRPRPHYNNRQLRVQSFNRWSPSPGGFNTGSTEYSTPCHGLMSGNAGGGGGGGGSPSQRRRTMRKHGNRRKMSNERSGALTAQLQQQQIL